MSVCRCGGVYGCECVSVWGCVWMRECVMSVSVDVCMDVRVWCVYACECVCM